MSTSTAMTVSSTATHTGIFPSTLTPTGVNPSTESIEGENMGAIYSGLITNDGYLFATNDIFGAAQEECAIVRVNRYCGAIVVTARGNFLPNVKILLERILPGISDTEWLSGDLAGEIVESFKREFEKDPSFRTSPLPFLFLLVGFSGRGLRQVEHIFIRNRVVEVVNTDDGKEYITGFDINHQGQSADIFYGHSELIEYLYRHLKHRKLNSEVMKLFTCFSFIQMQQLDNSLHLNIRMAAISDRGFEWVKEEELKTLQTVAVKFDTSLSEGLFDFFVSCTEDADVPAAGAVFGGPKNRL